MNRSTTGTFELSQDVSGKFRFCLIDGTHGVLLSSWAYGAKGDCKRAIESVQRLSQQQGRLVKQQTPNGTHRFRLVTAKGSAIGESPLYTVESEYRTAIQRIIRVAPIAEITDKSTRKTAPLPKKEKKPARAEARKSHAQVAEDESNSRPYRIYSAPLDADATPDDDDEEDIEYGTHSSKNLLIDGFPSADERDEFWESVIADVAKDSKHKGNGTQYEYRYHRADVPFKGGWDWVGSPLFSDWQLLSGNLARVRREHAGTVFRNE